MTNRMTAQGYTAWDNVFAGNRYNLRLWLGGFKGKLRDGLDAQIRAIMTKEGLSAASGIIGLAIVFAAMAAVAVRDAGNMEVLIALAATLPRQIDMTSDIHSFTSGWNDLLAGWARMTGVADNMHPEPDPRLRRPHQARPAGAARRRQRRAPRSLDEAMQLILRQPTGRINVRGPNGAGKSTLLTSLKSAVKARAYYWPTADRLAFAFSHGQDEVETDEDGDPIEAGEPKSPAISSGERQLQRCGRSCGTPTHRSICSTNGMPISIPNNRAAADALVEELARRARVVEISHRDRV